MLTDTARKRVILGCELETASGTFWLVIANVCSFFLGLVAARTLSEQLFGQYQFIASAVQLISIFALPGLATAAAQSIARGYDASLVEAKWARFRGALLGSLLLVLGAGAAFGFGRKEYGLSLFCVAICTPLTFSNITVGAYFVGKRQFRRYTACSVLLSGWGIAMVLVSGWFDFGLVGLVGGIWGGTALLSWAVYRQVVRKLDRSSPRDEGLASYGWELTQAAWMPIVTASVDRLLVFSLLGNTVLAGYAVAMVIPEQLVVISDSLRLVLLSRFSRQEELERRRLLRSVLVLAFGLAALLALVSVWLIPWGLHLCFGSKYDHVAGWAQLAAWGVVAVVPQKVLQAYLEACRLGRKLIGLQLVMGATKCLGCLGLILWCGFPGAVAAYLLTWTIALIFTGWMVWDFNPETTTPG